jgi:hypothetical protein
MCCAACSTAWPHAVTIAAPPLSTALPPAVSFRCSVTAGAPATFACSSAVGLNRSLAGEASRTERRHGGDRSRAHAQTPPDRIEGSCLPWASLVCLASAHRRLSCTLVVVRISGRAASSTRARSDLRRGGASGGMRGDSNMRVSSIVRCVSLSSRFGVAGVPPSNCSHQSEETKTRKKTAGIPALKETIADHHNKIHM